MIKGAPYIVVTGGAGFIGSHLVDRLARHQRAHILVYDNLRRGRLENLATHNDNPAVTFVQGDVRDYAQLAEAISGATYVFHLAAQSRVMGAVKDVDYSFATNVVGTFNLLKAAHAGGARRVIFTSSREVYGEAQYTPVDEGHPLDSKNTYGASKAAGELYCRVFSNNFGLESAILRLANVYGPRDFGRVIPLWLDLAGRGEPLTVFGGRQLIDFIWIDHVVEALLRAAEAGAVTTPINIGSGRGTPILELAERLRVLFPSSPDLDLRPARDAEVVRFVADVTRMQTLLNLSPPADPLEQLGRLVTEAPSHS